MNAEEMFKRNRVERTERTKHVKEMQRILETPLDPSLDYFDATASIEAIAKHVADLHKLIAFLSQTMIAQGQSLIRQGQEIVEFKADLAAAGIERSGGSERVIVGTTPPSLVGFDKKRN